MKAARLVVLGVAIAAGGMAAFLAAHVHRSPAPKPVAHAALPLKTVDVLIAKTNLGRGTLLAPKDIGWQTWPQAAANPSFITKTAQPNAVGRFTGAIVRVPVAAGQPIYDPMVVFAKGSGFLSAILPKGMRAVAIEVEPASVAGGFILPGDHVDVLVTRTATKPPAGSESQQMVSETILKNVTVLAVGQKLAEQNGKKVAVGRTATLEVTPPQAERLALASRRGSLTLTLRSLLDSQSPRPESVAQQKIKQMSITTVRYGVSALSMR
jgi:pilus assembly protein CpaB